MCDKRGSTFIAVQHLSIDPKGRHRRDLRLTDKVVEVGIRAGHISSALADQKHNAAQAEYDRLAALVRPEALEIPRWNYVCRRYAPRFMDISIFLATVLAFALVRLGAMHFN